MSGKHKKLFNKDTTSANPVMRLLKDSPVDEDRRKKDIEIVDRGWNNTEEGQRHLLNGSKRKHAK